MERLVSSLNCPTAWSQCLAAVFLFFAADAELHGNRRDQ